MVGPGQIGLFEWTLSSEKRRGRYERRLIDSAWPSNCDTLVGGKGSMSSRRCDLMGFRATIDSKRAPKLPRMPSQFELCLGAARSVSLN